MTASRITKNKNLRAGCVTGQFQFNELKQTFNKENEVAQVPLTFFTSRLAECQLFFPSAFDFVESFAGYILSAP